eukprot:25563_1
MAHINIYQKHQILMLFHTKNHDTFGHILELSIYDVQNAGGAVWKQEAQLAICYSITRGNKKITLTLADYNIYFGYKGSKTLRRLQVLDNMDIGAAKGFKRGYFDILFITIEEKGAFMSKKRIDGTHEWIIHDDEMKKMDIIRQHVLNFSELCKEYELCLQVEEKRTRKMVYNDQKNLGRVIAAYNKVSAVVQKVADSRYKPY